MKGRMSRSRTASGLQRSTMPSRYIRLRMMAKMPFSNAIPECTPSLMVCIIFRVRLTCATVRSLKSAYSSRNCRLKESEGLRAELVFGHAVQRHGAARVIVLGQGGEEIEKPAPDLRADVADVAGVNEAEFVAGEQHVAGVHVAVKRADAEHEEAVDVEQLQQRCVTQFARLEQLIEAGAGNELGHHHVLVAQRLMHAREREAREVKRLAVLVANGAQGLLAGNFVTQVQLAQGVFLDVTEDADGIADLAELWDRRAWRGETGA